MKRPITKLNEFFFLRVIEELIAEIWLSHKEEREVFKITYCVAYVLQLSTSSLIMPTRSCDSYFILQMRSKSNVVSLLTNRCMQEATTCEDLQKYVIKRRWRTKYVQKGNTKYIISFSYIARSVHYIYIKTLVTLTNAQFYNSLILSITSSSYPSVFWLVGSLPSEIVASHSFHCSIT
jgi:uncharacterized membrane protein